MSGVANEASPRRATAAAAAATLYIHSAFGDPPGPVCEAAREGWVEIVDQPALDAARLAAAHGIVTGNQLDQDAFLTLRPAVEAFLDAGGRWFFNGHVARPLVAGLIPFVPMAAPKRVDFDLSRLAPHPILDDLDLSQLETNRGVAGFYGRGHNPMPEGAVAVTGLRGGSVPVDWVWCRPAGGHIFSHAGNDLGEAGREWDLPAMLHRRILDWAKGGPCLCD